MNKGVIKNETYKQMYQRRLARYFDEHYSQYEDTVELTCRENGNVEECIFNKEI